MDEYEKVTDMNSNDHNTLSEREEKLLMQLHDDECGFLQRLRARRLLKQSDTARAFVKQLDSVTVSVRGISSHETSIDLSGMWDRVALRIEQEERAEIFLGRRKAVSEEPRSSWMAAVWGMSGVLAAASLALVIVQRGDDGAAPGVSGIQVASQAGIPQLQSRGVSLGGESPRIVQRPEQAVEVDWVRSDGQVRFIADGRQRTSLIWVKKRSPAMNWAPTSRRIGSSAAVPTLRSLNPQNSDVPVILEESLPQSRAATVNR